MAKYKGTTPGDFLVHEESAIICRESIAITNPTAAPFVAKVGQPVDGGTLVVDAGEAGTDSFLLEEVSLDASETTVLTHSVLVRGPAAINGAKIALVDSAGDSMDLAALKAAAVALGIVVRDEPAVTDVQTN